LRTKLQIADPTYSADQLFGGEHGMTTDDGSKHAHTAELHCKVSPARTGFVFLFDVFLVPWNFLMGF
jgi:hypothetical protein